MNKARLERIERLLDKMSRQVRRQIIRVVWPDGRISGPEPGPSDDVVMIRVVYDGNERQP